MPDVLMLGLSAAVPLYIAELWQIRGHARCRRLRSWAHDAADAIAQRGDLLQFGGKRGEPASVFDHLARGLAALAYSPGGVYFGGWHWCLKRHRMGVEGVTFGALDCGPHAVFKEAGDPGQPALVDISPGYGGMAADSSEELRVVDESA